MRRARTSIPRQTLRCCNAGSCKYPRSIANGLGMRSAKAIPLPKGSEFVGYVPAGTVVTPELMQQLMRMAAFHQESNGARMPYDFDLKANPVGTESA